MLDSNIRRQARIMKTSKKLLRKIRSPSLTHPLHSLRMHTISQAIHTQKEFSHNWVHTPGSSLSRSTLRPRSNSTPGFFQNICTYTTYFRHRTCSCSQIGAATSFMRSLRRIFLSTVLRVWLGSVSDASSTCVSFNLASHNCGYVAQRYFSKACTIHLPSQADFFFAHDRAHLQFSK